MSVTSRVGALCFFALLGALVAAASGNSPLAGAGLSVGLALAGSALLLVPEAMKVLGVLVLFAPISAPLGAAYTGLTSQSGQVSSADAVGGSIALLVFVLISVWVAARYSRGRVWVTVAAVCGAALFPGLALSYAFPPLGLNGARLSMALVLAFRCGGWAWVSGAGALALEGLKGPGRAEKQATSEDVQQGADWLKRAGAEQLTAEALAALDGAHQVLHDVRVKGSPTALGHLVLGPGGGFLLASVSSDGEVSEDRMHGVTLPGVPLDRVAGTLLEQRRTVAKQLRCAERDFSLIIVVHGDGSQGLRKAIAVFEAGDQSLPSGQVMLVGPDALLPEVSPGYVLWSPLKVRQASRLAAMRLSPALVPVPVSAQPAALPRLAPLTEDGEALLSVSVEDIVPSWLVPGAVVHIKTSQGVLTDLRVTGEPYVDQLGRLVVPLCVEEEWLEAQEHMRMFRSHPYPVRSVLPA